MIEIDTNKYYEVNDAARILGVNARTIARLVKENKIKCFKPSERKTYFTKEMIQNYLEGK
jgi:excisionase family DNA binding protein